MKIFKETLPVDDRWRIRTGRYPLHVGLEAPGVLAFWRADHDDSASREYRVFGTGHEIEDACAYEGTVQDPPFVWHLFSREDQS